MKIDLEAPDPTLEAADRALEEIKNKEVARPYLGASIIGDECLYKLWAYFRWGYREYFDAITLKRFEDGHRTEDLMAERLRLAPGVSLQTLDAATGKQIAVEACAGHFRGHADGVISGLVQAPKTKHVWEGKCVNEKKLAKLDALKGAVGEKNALREWDYVYFAQGVIYMHVLGLTRHYLTCASPGGRSWTAVRTDADPAEAMRLLAKAARIVFSDDPPQRISPPQTAPPCQWCAAAALCRGDEAPPRHCRTCIFSRPTEDGPRAEGGGTWRCARWGRADGVDPIIPLEIQRAGCPAHRYNPGFVPGEQVDASTDLDWIEYAMRDGSSWIDFGQEEVS